MIKSSDFVRWQGKRTLQRQSFRQKCEQIREQSASFRGTARLAVETDPAQTDILSQAPFAAESEVKSRDLAEKQPAATHKIYRIRIMTNYTTHVLKRRCSMKNAPRVCTTLEYLMYESEFGA